MKKKLLFTLSVYVICNFFSCNSTAENEFPFRGEWRITKTEGENIATIEGTLFTFNDDGTLTAQKGLISNKGNFSSSKKGEVTFSYSDQQVFHYSFKKIDKKSFWLKKRDANETFYFEKE